MKKTLLTIILTIISLASFAQDACIDGIYYNFTDSTATVTYLNGTILTPFRRNDHYIYIDECDVVGALYILKDSTAVQTYKGDVTIPKEVEYNGKKYPVTEIGDSAFFIVINSHQLTFLILSNGLAKQHSTDARIYHLS